MSYTFNSVIQGQGRKEGGREGGGGRRGGEGRKEGGREGGEGYNR